jgi:predicted nucleic acid-binding protein
MTDLVLKGRIVSNTGPIIALMITGKLNILKELFDEVMIPYEVHQELLKGKSEKDFINLMRVTVYEGENVDKSSKTGNFSEPCLKGYAGCWRSLSYPTRFRHQDRLCLNR